MEVIDVPLKYGGLFCTMFIVVHNNQFSWSVSEEPYVIISRCLSTVSLSGIWRTDGDLSSEVSISGFRQEMGL